MFINIPVDDDTEVISRVSTTFLDQEALKEVWLWDGMLGHSIIISKASMPFNIEEIRTLIQNTGLLDGVFIVQEKDQYIFINHSFDLL